MTTAARAADRRPPASSPDAAGSPLSGAAPGVRTATRRMFAVALLLALIAHIPALPFDSTFLARILLHSVAPPPPAPPEDEPETLFPIDLDLLSGLPQTDDVPGVEQPVPPTVAQGAAEDSPAPSAAPQPAPQKSPEKPASRPDDIYDDLDAPRRAVSTLKDPLTVAGGPGKIGPKDPNVQVLFNGNRLRGNTAGAALGSILTALPDWKSFFEGTKLDPIQDADQLLIAGPQLRKSGGVFVWMHYRVPEPEMKGAIDTIIKRTKGGRWLKGTPVPAAVGRAHDAARIFALIPGKKLLLVLPRKAQDQLRRAKEVRPFNTTSKAGIVISLLTPRNAFADYLDVVDVPASYKWLRMVVTPLSSGDAEVAMEIGDSSAEEAAKHGPMLEKQLAQVRSLAKIATVIGADVLPPMKVVVDKDILRVNATITRKGLNHIVNLARTHFEKRAEQDRKKAEEEEKKKGGASKEEDDLEKDEKDGEGDKEKKGGGAPSPTASPSGAPGAPGLGSASASAASPTAPPTSTASASATTPQAAPTTTAP